MQKKFYKKQIVKKTIVDSEVSLILSEERFKYFDKNREITVRY